MANRRTTTEQIEAAKKEIEQKENRLKELLQKQKTQERSLRTKRLCKRAGLLESMLPDTIALTDEQFKAFLEKTTANDFGRRQLATLTAQNAATAAPKAAEATVQGKPAPAAKTAETAQEGGTGTPRGEGNGIGQSG